MTEIMEADLKRLFDKVQVVEQSWRYVKDEIAKRLAPDFTPFQFVRTSELGLSELLRWMLDSRETHGQGKAFFGLFLKHLDLPWHVTADQSLAVIEERTWTLNRENRRIDVVVRTGQYLMAVENKPHAGYQVDQVVDYLIDIGRKQEANYCLVCIQGADAVLPEFQRSADGVTAALSERKLIVISYQQLHGWIEECAKFAEAPSVAYFLRDFATFVAVEFMGEKSAMSDKSVSEAIMADPQTHRAALSVLSAGEELLAPLGEIFVRDVKAILPDNMTTFLRKDQGLSSIKGDSGLSISFDTEMPLALDMKFYRAGYREPYVGLVDYAATDNTYPAVRSALAQRGYRWRAQPYWVAWQHLEKLAPELGTANDQAELWRMMLDGRLSRWFVDFATRLRDDLVVIGALPWDGSAFQQGGMRVPA